MEQINLKLKKDVLAFCFEDSADLLAIECIVSRFFKNKEREKENTLKVVKILLDESVIQAGFVLTNGIFEKWDKSNNEIIHEIKVKWNNLKRELFLGDVVWFQITKKGRKEFEYLNSLPELQEDDPFYDDE